MPADSLQISDGSDTNAKTQPERKGRFRKGQSGNPAGRRRGSHNRKTLLMQQLFDGEGEALVRKAVEMGLAGDPTALRLCVERLVAPRRDRVVELDLPNLDGTADLPSVMRSVIRAGTEGRITPFEAQAFAQAVATAVEAIRTQYLEERLREVEETIETLEAKSNGNPDPPRRGWPSR
jgi:Family of unknown function (DUF5681)